LLAKQFFRGEIAIRGAELVSECFARRFFDPRCQLGLAVHQRMQIQRIQSEQPRWCHRPQPTMTLAFRLTDYGRVALEKPMLRSMNG